MSGLFDYIGAINDTKQNLIIDEESEKEFNKLRFMILRGLSNNVDTVIQANEMNRYPSLSANMTNDFLIQSIKKKKRFGKWAKKESTTDDLDLVIEYYNLSRNKAETVLSLLTKDQLNIIKEKMLTGGKKK